MQQLMLHKETLCPKMPTPLLVQLRPVINPGLPYCCLKISNTYASPGTVMGSYQSWVTLVLFENFKLMCLVDSMNFVCRPQPGFTNVILREN